MTRRGAPYHNLSGEAMDFNFDAIEASIAAECKDLPENIGVSVALFRLRELIAGYRFALSCGYNAIPVGSSEHLNNWVP